MSTKHFVELTPFVVIFSVDMPDPHAEHDSPCAGQRHKLPAVACRLGPVDLLDGAMLYSSLSVSEVLNRQSE